MSDSWDRTFPLVCLICSSASGKERRFEIRVEGANQGNVWSYFAKPIPHGKRIPRGEYQAMVERIGPDIWQTVVLKNGLPKRYHGFGISRTLIPIIAGHRSARIRSSRRTKGETFTPAAERVWKRMVAEGLARYDRNEDRYFHPAD